MTNRMHVALNVSDLESSRRFYEDLFGTAPDKVRADYIRFQVDDPPLALTLNVPRTLTKGTRLSHLGIRVAGTDQLRAAHDRLAAAGHKLKVEDGTTCCYALQDKFWVTDPDGNDWEYYQLLDDAPEEGQARTKGEGANPCCDG
jgi:catechol 2,3-dioxygenase-like lactoylglutathione lyase family enzyme